MSQLSRCPQMKKFQVSRKSSQPLPSPCLSVPFVSELSLCDFSRYNVCLVTVVCSIISPVVVRVLRVVVVQVVPGPRLHTRLHKCDCVAGRGGECTFPLTTTATVLHTAHCCTGDRQIATMSMFQPAVVPYSADCWLPQVHKCKVGIRRLISRVSGELLKFGSSSIRLWTQKIKKK